MRIPRLLLTCGVSLSLSLVAGCSDQGAGLTSLSPIAPSRDGSASAERMATLGERIFNDQTLSLKRNQSCASCHEAAFGFTSPNAGVNAGGAVMFGSVATRFGSRKPPSAAYATQAPVLYYDEGDDTFVGGNFWDGRATGARLGNPSAEQAQAPFTNGVELALPDVACVLFRIARGSYLSTYTSTFGPTLKSVVWPATTGSLCEREGSTVPLSPGVRATILQEFDNTALAIAAFEASPAVNSFSSKYDYYLAGKVALTADEEAGRQLYEGQAGCIGCHSNIGKGALMTDYTYDNIGVPANPQNPSLATNASFRDLGLGGVLSDPARYGQQKVPTLRNIDKREGNTVKGYMHNGVFKSIEQVVHFYNTRDVLPRCRNLAEPRFGVNCWTDPEVEENVNMDELGNLGLTARQETQLVAYLRTLNDGFVLPKTKK